MAYDSRMASGGSSLPPVAPAENASVTLTPEVKQMIAEEVQQQLQAERAAAGQPSASPAGTSPGAISDDPPALDPKTKIFVVSTVLNVDPTDGQNCALTPGDIIERKSRTLTADGKVSVGVLNSKEGDCSVDTETTLDIATLQDMHNQFREQISAGMEKLASSQGKDGLPTGPAASARQVAEGQAMAAADAKDLLTKQVQDADQTEADVRQATGVE